MANLIVVATSNEYIADASAVREKTLPKHVIIQSNLNNRYLHLYTENPDVPNALRYTGDYSFDLDTRFQVEPATTGTGLIHIRSLRNNKYLANFGTGNNWVTAMADKPEENQSLTHCTLFQPIFMDSNNHHRVVKLRHVSTGSYVRLFNGGSGHYNCCLCLWPDEDRDVCTFIDWESVVMLPELIRINIGVNIGYHLKANAGGNGYLDYNDKADNSSLFDYEVYPSRDGGIRLKNVRFGKYMRDMDDSIWLRLQEASDTVHDINTVFLPTIVDGNGIVIRSLKSNKFCNRHSTGNMTGCLARLDTYPNEYSYMVIEEPIFSRKINNVVYHLKDARIYNERSVALISDDSSNHTQDPLVSELNLKTTVTNTAKWSTSVSLTLGVKMSLTFGVPLIESGTLEISAEHTTSSCWGNEETESLEMGSVKTVTLQPMSRVKGTLMATRVSYDIPFSYTQHDVLKNGTIKVSEKNDGLFTGHNGYGYKYEVAPLPLK